MEEASPQVSLEELYQTESEVQVDANVEKCLVCKSELTGDVFVCPACKNAKYHRACVESLIKSGEPCWICKQPFITSDAAKEAEAIQKDIRNIDETLVDLGFQFKENKLSHESFAERSGQLLKEKFELESKLKKTKVI